MKRMGKVVDPLAESKEIKRKLSLELSDARKKGKYWEKVQEIHRRAQKILRSRKKAARR